MFEDQDLVTHNHSHQGNNTHDGCKTEGAVHQGQANEHTRQHQSEGSDTDKTDTVFLEVEEQEEEDDDHGNGHTSEDLRQGLSIILYLSSHLGANALRQWNLVLHDVGNPTLHGGSIGAIGKLAGNGDAAFASTVHDTTLAPLGFHLGNLTERYCCVTASCSCRYDRHRGGHT